MKLRPSAVRCDYHGRSGSQQRFPDDFVFQLSKSKYYDLKSQIMISSQHGGRRSPPYAFTEQGVYLGNPVSWVPASLEYLAKQKEPHDGTHHAALTSSFLIF